MDPVQEKTSREILSQEELDFLLAPPDGESALTPMDPEDLAEPGDEEWAKDDLPGQALSESRQSRQNSGRQHPAGRAQAQGREERAGKPKHQPGSVQDSHFQTARFFALLFARELAQLLKTEVRLADMTRSACRAEDLLDSLEEPAFHVLLEAEPVAGRILLSCEPGLAQVLADASLGAAPAPGGLLRPLGLLDRELVLRCLKKAAPCLAETLGLARCPTLATGRYLDDIFLTHSHVPGDTPGERLVVSRFVLNVGGAQGGFLLVTQSP